MPTATHSPTSSAIETRRALIGKKGRPTVRKRRVQREIEQAPPAEGGQTEPVIEEREEPVIEGYASVFYDGTPETQFQLWHGTVERIMPGAFSEAVDDDVAALRNHNPDMLLGRTTAEPPTLTLEEDKIGLRYEIQPPSTPVGNETVELIRRGDMQGSSFAFNIVEERWVEEEVEGVTIEVREIIKVELFDVGPVTFPAYEASTTGIRSLDRDLAEARASHAQWKAAVTDRAKARGKAEAPASLSRSAILARARVVELIEQG